MKFLLSIFLFFASYFALAQQETVKKDTVNKLQEVVISASRVKESILKSPVDIQVLTKTYPFPIFF